MKYTPAKWECQSWGFRV